MTDQRLPPLPSLRVLTAELRALHEAWSHPDAGGEYVRLVCEINCEAVEWRAATPGDIEFAEVMYTRDLSHPLPSALTACIFGREWIPGDGAPFDATAAARRLLAAARDAGCV